MMRRILGHALAIAAAAIVVIATVDDAAARDRRSHGGRGGGGGWHRGGGAFHHHRTHFRSFVFLGGSFGTARYYPAYYYPPAPLPPPVYVSKDDTPDCYNTVARGPGVADLYTCGGAYIGPIAVP